MRVDPDVVLRVDRGVVGAQIDGGVAADADCDGGNAEQQVLDGIAGDAEKIPEAAGELIDVGIVGNSEVIDAEVELMAAAVEGRVPGEIVGQIPGVVVAVHGEAGRSTDTVVAGDFDIGVALIDGPREHGAETGDGLGALVGEKTAKGVAVEAEPGLVDGVGAKDMDPGHADVLSQRIFRRSVAGEIAEGGNSGIEGIEAMLIEERVVAGEIVDRAEVMIEANGRHLLGFSEQRSRYIARGEERIADIRGGEAIKNGLAGAVDGRGWDGRQQGGAQGLRRYGSLAGDGLALRQFLIGDKEKGFAGAKGAAE